MFELPSWKMGALRPRRGSSPSQPLWQQDQKVSSFLSLALAGCRTMFLLVVASFLGLFILRVVLPAQTVSKTSTSINQIIVDGVGHVTNLEDRKSREKLYLAAVIFNRVFKQDLFNITAYECQQWIEYMLFSGVEHIYWYDTAHSDAESQEVYMQKYVKKGLLTYHRFHHLHPGNVDAGYHFEQDNSYDHFLKKYGASAKWVVEMDVDEYPFMLSDAKRDFLRRHVEYTSKSRPDVTQILMPCMIFGGNPKGDLENGWVIERYQRRKRATEGNRAGFRVARTKPIFQPKHTQGVGLLDPHQFPMASGDTLVSPPETLRMNHYWGARLSDFGPDTSAVLALLVPDVSAQVIAYELKTMSLEEAGLDHFERVMEGITHVEVLAGTLAEGITHVEVLAGTLAEVMQQRLLAIENCLSGIFGGLDGLHQNIHDVKGNVQAAAQKCRRVEKVRKRRFGFKPNPEG